MVVGPHIQYDDGSSHGLSYNKRLNKTKNLLLQILVSYIMEYGERKKTVTVTAQSPPTLQNVSAWLGPYCGERGGGGRRGGEVEKQPAWMLCENTPSGSKCTNGTERRRPRE